MTLTVDKINIREDLNFHLRFALDILFVVQALRIFVPRPFLHSLHKIKKKKMDAQQVGLVRLSAFHILMITVVYIENCWMGLVLAQRNFGRCSTENDWIACDK